VQLILHIHGSDAGPGLIPDLKHVVHGATAAGGDGGARDLLPQGWIVWAGRQGGR
jgi:hypothetical protein